MNGGTTLRVCLFAAACVAASQSTSQAGLSYFNVSGYTDYSSTVYAQGYGKTTLASAIVANWQSVPGSQSLPASHSDPFLTFCLDFNTGLANGWWKSGAFSDASLTSQSSPAVRQADGFYRAASLYRHYSPGILNVAGNGSGFSWADKQKGAALQLAIWEVLYEKGDAYSLDFDNSRSVGDQFYAQSVDASVRSLANTMLSSQWNDADPNLDTTFWNAVNADGRTPRDSQDLLGPIGAVPEPSTCIAGVLLVLPFLASTIRKRR